MTACVKVGHTDSVDGQTSVVFKEPVPIIFRLDRPQNLKFSL